MEKLEDYKIVTVSYGLVKGKAKNFPYYQPALYHPYFSKKSKSWTWKYIKHIKKARRSRNLAKLDALEINLPYYDNIRQYVKITPEIMGKIKQETQCV